MDEFIATYKAKNIQKKEEYIITILETFYKYKDFFSELRAPVCFAYKSAMPSLDSANQSW